MLRFSQLIKSFGRQTINKNISKNQFSTQNDSVKSIKHYSISAQSPGVQNAAVSYTSLGNQKESHIHSPLEGLLGSLIGCEYATAQFIAKQEFGVNITKINVQNADLAVDLRGFMGMEGFSAIPSTIKMKLEIETEATQEQLNQIHHKVSLRCPVYVTLKAAGVKFEDEWIKI